ncbi:MAG: hypothetical protein CMJ58_15945 [Planctomycetaceae bacterium]|nr:hypothetical protein [Planctomycetaceae bacterium]
MLTLRPAAAQDELLPPMAGDFGGEDLPPAASMDFEPGDAMAEDSDDRAAILQPWYDSRAGAQRVMDACPALMESSGTWLRRGYWYSEVDAMLLNRRFTRGSVILGREMAAFASTNFSLATFNNVLEIGNDPGADGLPRVTVGRFLFRDEANRDHTTEFTWFGGGDWNQTGYLAEANPGVGISVPTSVDMSNNLGLPNEGTAVALGNISFDGASLMFFDYRSELDSFEWNYRVRDRMQRDQMVLRPDGEWVRRAQSSGTMTFLAGLRYMNTLDSLYWTAEGTGDPTTTNDDRVGSGVYDIKADNDLIGTQLGLGYAYETSRWSLGAEVKGGGYLNMMGLDSKFSITNTDTDTVINSGEVHTNAENLSFVGQVTVSGKWHFRPNMSLRMGMELLYVESIALATNQIHFTPGGSSQIANGGDNVLLGTSIGMESYW